jgi:hypothetical protein
MKDVIEFVKPLMEHKDTEVRDLSYSLVARLANVCGMEAISSATSTLRDAQKSVLEQKIEKMGGASKTQHKTKSEKSEETDKKKATKSKHESESKKSTSKSSSKNESTKEKKKEKLKQSAGETCIFCHQDSIDPSELENHYSKDCPYLTNCPHCKLLVEIPTLYNHLNASCELAQADQKLCGRCNDLIPAKDYRGHVSKKSCKPWDPHKGTSVCGLCHKKVEGEAAWEKHLRGDKLCPGKRKSVGFSDKTK